MSKKAKIIWEPVSEYLTTKELIDNLETALSLCSTGDIVLAATEGRDKTSIFTEFSLLQCDNCGTICSKSEQFLLHTLECMFDEKHVMFYKALGMIPKSAQRILDLKFEESSSMVGRALQNNPELCVMTPIESPLAPFIFCGVTVSTKEPKCKNTYTKAMVEGACMKNVPIYFCVRAARRRFEEMKRYNEKKMAKRRFNELKGALKQFTIEAPDLLQFPPEDPEVAQLLHKATGLPIGTTIIPARKIYLRVPIFSPSDLPMDDTATTPSVSEGPVANLPTFVEEKPRIKDHVVSSSNSQIEEKPPTISTRASSKSFDRCRVI